MKDIHSTFGGNKSNVQAADIDKAKSFVSLGISETKDLE
jgi:hypothetical protein